MAQMQEMIFMKMTNGEYIYGTNLDIGKYSVEHDCECEFEFDHVPPMKLEGQGGYSEGSRAFKYVGKDHDPMQVSRPPRQKIKLANGEEIHTGGWDYKTGEYFHIEKW